MKKLLLLVLSILFFSGLKTYSQVIDTTRWIFNGNVNSIVKDDLNNVYVGGDFTYAGPQYAYLAKMTDTLSTPDPNFPKANGEIRAVCSDGSGGWFVGGFFSEIGGVGMPGFAHILSDMTVDNNFSNFMYGPVYCIYVFGTNVYVGGDGFVRRLNKTTGIIDNAWNLFPQGEVYAIAVTSGYTYIGGNFNGIGGYGKNYLARVSTSTGTVDSSWNPEADFIVNALVINQGQNVLYVGGAFHTLFSSSHSKLAKIDLSTGNLSMGYNPDFEAGDVNAIAVDSDGKIFVGGSFMFINSQNRPYLVKLDMMGNVDATWNPDVIGNVTALASKDSYVYAGGLFTSAGGQDRLYFARLDDTNGNADASWICNASSEVKSIAVYGHNVIAGGSFKSIGGMSRNHLAKFDDLTGHIDSLWNPNSNGNVNALCVVGSDIYAGGFFTAIGGQTRNRIAKLNNSNGNADASWNANANEYIKEMTTDGTSLFVCGAFTNIGGQPRNYLAKLNLTNGNVEASFNPSPNAQVYSIDYNGYLYAGGDFTVIGTQSRNKIARLNNSNGNADGSWAPEANARVEKIKVIENDIYVGGQFSNIGGENRNFIARINYDGLADISWIPDADTTVLSFIKIGDFIYAGGRFTNIGGYPRNHIAKLNIFNGIADVNWNPGTYGNDVRCMMNTSEHLYLGGSFTNFGGKGLDYMATVESPPYFTGGNLFGQVCFGMDITMSMTASGHSPITYQWFHNNVPITGAINNTLELYNIAYSDSGLYYCVVSNTSGTDTSFSSETHVGQETIITDEPEDLNICFGESAAFNISATGELINYRWFHNGILIPGATASSYTINNAAPQDTGFYYCIASGGCGNDTSIYVHCSVNNLPIANAGNDIATCSGSSVTLHASGGETYEWSNGDHTQYATVIALSDTTEYYVTVTNSHGCSDTDTVLVTAALPYSHEQICLVTVDTITWKNKIMWEKTAGVGTDSFIVYKEQGTNIYVQIGAVPFNSSSYFIDNSSVPESHGDKYKIAVIDTCGNESGRSPFHKTMNLTISSFGSTMGLNWDDYVDESGLYVPTWYYIYRGSQPDNMSILDSVSGSFNSYNDINVFNVYYYIIGVKKNPPCNSGSAFSFSNKKDNSTLVNINSNFFQNGTILISPNPMSTSATLTIPSWHIANSQHSTVNGKLLIMDIAGKVVRTIPIPPVPHGLSPDKPSHAQLTIERGDLKPGIYFVELKADRIYRGKLVVE